jgi:hypothetical protein
MASKVVKLEAERLVREHGNEAYPIARAALSLAKRQRNIRMELFLGQVVLEVARRQKAGSPKAERSGPAPSPQQR